jgi:hypothetical protein
MSNIEGKDKRQKTEDGRRKAEAEAEAGGKDKR